MSTTSAPLKSYKELYSDPANDPSLVNGKFKPGYKEMNENWRTTNAALDEDELLKELLIDFEDPVGALCVFVKDPKSPTGVLKVLTELKQHPGTRGQPSPHRGKPFAFEGDVMGIDIRTIAFQKEYLKITPEITVAGDLDRHVELLKQEPQAAMIGPIPSNAQSKTIIKTRGCGFMPFRLVHLALGKDLTGREAIDILIPNMRSLGILEVCSHFVEFLVNHTTKPSATANGPLTLQDTVGVYPYEITPDITQYRREKILHIRLPGLVPDQTNTGRDPQMTELISKVADLSNQNREDLLDRQEQRKKAAEPKTVRKYFSDAICDMYLLMCGVTNDDALPTVLHELAGREKSHNKRLVVQRCVDLTAKELGYERGYVVTANDITTMESQDWLGGSIDQLGTGWSLFALTPPEATSDNARKATMEDRARNQQYDLSGHATDGEKAMSVADAKKLLNQKGYVPTDWDEADYQIEYFIIKLGLLIGTKHDVVTKHREAWKLYKSIRGPLKKAMNAKFGPRLGPALFTFYWHLQYRGYFGEQWNFLQTGTAAPPSITDDLKKFSRGRNLEWLPIYDEVPALVALSRTTRAPEGGGSGGGAGTGGGNPEPNPQARNNPPPPQNRTVRINNRNRDPRYVGNTPLAVNIRGRTVTEAIRTAGIPPQGTRNGAYCQRCVPWHVKGVCNTGCDRAEDHVEQLPDNEKEDLHTWVLRAFA